VTIRLAHLLFRIVLSEHLVAKRVRIPRLGPGAPRSTKLLMVVASVMSSIIRGLLLLAELTSSAPAAAP